MPAATTHVEFSKDVLKDFTQEQLQDLNLPMYFTGSQGPDLFFFSSAGVPPFTISKIGTYMHRNQVEEVIKLMILYCDGNKDLQSYLYGYLTHYILDSMMHPTICRLANKLEDDSPASNYVAHVSIEASIDTYLLNKQNKQYDVYKDLTLSNNDAKLLARMYYHIFTTLGIDVTRAKLEKTCHDLSRYTYWLSPSSNAKYKRVETIENILHAPHAVTGLMVMHKDIHAFYKQANEEFDETLFDKVYTTAMHKAMQAIQNPMDLNFRLNFLGETNKNTNS